MKLTSLQLKSFRSYVGTELDLSASRVVIAGVNGAGKSSVRDAIAWALTGSTPELSGKGSTGEMLVPDFTGVQNATASVVVDGIGRVERAWTSSGGSLAVTNWTGPATAQQSALYEHVKASEALIHILCDARAFLRLGHAEAKAALLDVLQVKVEVPLASGAVTYTLEQIDAEYDAMFKERAAAKKVLTSLQVPPEPVVAEKFHPVETYEKRLSDLRADLSKQREAIGHTTGRRQVLHGQIELARKRLVKVDPETVQLLRDSIAETSARLEAGPVVEMGVQSPQRIVWLQDAIQKLEAQKGCGSCIIDGSIPCKTHEKNFDAVIAAYEQERRAQELLPESSESAALASLASRLEADKAELARLEAAVAKNFDINEEIAALSKEIAALPDVSAQEADIAQAEAYILKGEDITRRARAFFAARKAYEDALSARQQQEQRVADLEHLCDLLGPNGARVQALTKALASFEASINPYLEPFGWQIHIEAQPWVVRVNRRAAQTYSKSEQYRIGVALQLAMAQASGLSFAVVDEFDILDAATRNIVGKMVMLSKLEQIILLTTREPEMKLPVPSGAFGYRLDKKDGRSVVIEAVKP